MAAYAVPKPFFGKAYGALELVRQHRRRSGLQNRGGTQATFREQPFERKVQRVNPLSAHWLTSVLHCTPPTKQNSEHTSKALRSPSKTNAQVPAQHTADQWPVLSEPHI